MAPTSGILNSFLAAIQASLSVLLVISYGALAAKYNLLSSSSAKVVSKICVKMFLPALLFTQIGAELHYESAGRYLIILVWALLAHLLSFLIGIAGHLLFGLPDWITVAVMFNNTTSYPLLLIQALDQTGILQSLVTSDETTKQAIERAKSYFLVFATVSSCLCFAVGPRLMDSEHAFEPASKEEADVNGADGEDDDQALPTEETGLLAVPSGYGSHRGSVSFFPSRREASISNNANRRQSAAVIYDRRPSVIPKRTWLDLHPTVRWWLLFIYDFFNAPLLGAILGAIVGLVPVLHRAFFNDTANGGIFTPWFTASLKNIGSLFVPLPVLVAGVSLYTSNKQNKTEETASSQPRTVAESVWLTTTVISIIRFVLWPVFSIGLVYLLITRTTLLGDDPMLWFALMLMPTGPPAMKLITMVEVSDADEEDENKIAKLLTISYIISPLLAFTVVGSLQASKAGIPS